MSGPPGTELRILLITKGLDIGGLERMVVALALGFRRQGYDVEVAVVNDRRDRLVPELEAGGVEVHRLGGTDRIGLKGALGLARLVRSNRFDLVHVHGPLPSVVCRLVRGDRLPIVTTSHTVLSALRPVTRLAWRLTARRDAAHIAVSEVVGQSTKAPFMVIPHGVDFAAAAAAVDTARRNGSDDEVSAICVASHRPAKNYPNLLRAVAAVRDAGVRLQLVAIGEGPDLDGHKRLARELEIDDIVTFESPTPDVLRRIAGADLLVVSSDWEGQPIVIAESLAVGTPVVSTAVGQAYRLVSDDMGRVVPAGDHVALAAALSELAGDSRLRARMSTAAKRGAVMWTLGDAVDAHLQMYRSVLTHGGRSPLLGQSSAR